MVVVYTDENHKLIPNSRRFEFMKQLNSVSSHQLNCDDTDITDEEHLASYQPFHTHQSLAASTSSLYASHSLGCI